MRGLRLHCDRREKQQVRGPRKTPILNRKTEEVIPKTKGKIQDGTEIKRREFQETVSDHHCQIQQKKAHYIQDQKVYT